MQIAYFDCFSGISGDMTLGALIDAGAELGLVQMAIASMDLPQVRLSVSNTAKRGFRGKLLSIEHPVEHPHRFLRDIHSMLRGAKISMGAKDLSMRIFERLARAEAKVHGTTIDRIQFHEVGAIDSIVDIVGTAVAWDALGIQKAYASPIPTGAGQIRIAHGIVSVPAPATAELLLGVPIAPTQIPIEMTTPTGAAIVTELATEFGPIPPMQVGRIGYGAGRKDMPDRANLLRILIGNSLKPRSNDNDFVLVLESNLDDISAEQIGYAIDQLWKAGALDVFTAPIQMKKNRPGTLLTVIAKPLDRSAMESILFQQTGTLGIRYRKQARTVLPRTKVEVPTPWGMISGKLSKLPSGDSDFSPEFDDCSKVASSFGLRFPDVVRKVQECYLANSKLKSATDADAADAIFLDGASALLNSEATLERVNTVFRQAAIEDELDPVANAPEIPKTHGSSKNATTTEASTEERPLSHHSATDAQPELAQHEQAVDFDHVPEINAPIFLEPESNEEVMEVDESKTEQQGYYRWDSFPWSREEPR